MSGFTQFIIGILLRILPGLGSWGGPLGVAISLLLTESAKIIYNTIKYFVLEAEDPIKHPEFVGEGKGFDKFDWVFNKAWGIVAEKGIDLARRQVSFLIELAVSALKK